MTRSIPSLALTLLLSACADDPAADADPSDTGTPDTGTPDTGTEPDPVDYADRGAWTVGYTVVAEDPSADTPEVKAWYPTASQAEEAATYSVSLKLPGFGTEPVPFLGAAVVDAAPAAGTFPLVVLSHGFGMNPEWYHPLAEHLASHGFVVLGPEHMESDWAADVIGATADRPVDVSRTIDLAEDGLLDGVIDADRVAVIGHSYGGYTALAVGGARFDSSFLVEECPAVEDPFVLGMFCTPFLDGQEELADALGLADVPEGLWPSLADDRVDAVISMAPDAFQFGEAGLAELSVPLLVMGGTGDTASHWEWGAGLAYDHASSDTLGLVAFEGADHFVQVTTCEHMPWTSALPEEYASYFCEDPAWDKEAALALTNELALAFVVHSLDGDEAARAALDPARYADVAGLDVEMVLP